jgi:hypothetical protein
MNWDRSETIALAKESCAKCQGEGQAAIRFGHPRPCNCVLRNVFRACYARFRHCVTKEKFMSRVSLVPCLGKDQRLTYARLDEDYICDFSNVSRRALNNFDYNIFRYHFLLGADWRLICRQMKLDRGEYFHALYRIQQRLGRVFGELKPYSLYPISEYFAGTLNRSNLAIMPLRRKQKPVRPPLRKSA